MKHLLFSSQLIIMAALIISCSTVSNISVKNAGSTDALQQDVSFIYALPQTVLDVRVTADEISVIPGPFEKYAGKYLGIHNAPSRAERIFVLKNFDIKKHLEADPDFVYTVSGVQDPFAWPELNNLIKDSLILTAADFSSKQTSSFSWPVQTPDILYTDLSVKRNFEAEKDIEISMVLPDTDYVPPPVNSRSVLKEKTPEQKAEEAANFIIKLKKRRFKLVAGQYEHMPDGESMSAALKELARLEEEYLALFIGRRIITEITRNFHYTPESGENQNRAVLFRFSQSRGIINADDAEGIPVILELQPMNKMRELGNVKIPVRPLVNTLPYRIADQVNIRLLAGEQLWAEAIYPVFQFGTPVTMSLKK